MKRCGKKNISLAGAVEFYRLAVATLVDCLLDALCVHTAFVRVG